MPTKPFLWLVWAFAIIIVAGGGVFNWIAKAEFSPSSAYTGAVQVAATPLQVKLPISATIESILVEPTDHVLAGETLVTYDVANLLRRKDAVSEQILARSQLLDCLSRSEKLGADAASLPKNDQRLPNPDLMECSQNREEMAARLDRFDQELLILKGKKQLLDGYLSEINFGTGAGNGSMQRALALSMARNRLEERVLKIARERQLIESESERARIRDVRRVMNDIENLIETKDRLEVLVSEPRILAPQSGNITRVRQTRSDAEFPANETLIEMVGEEAPRFVAWFLFPLDAGPQINIGASVGIQLLGGLDFPHLLTGTVEQIKPADAHQIKAIVTLSDQSDRVLAANPLGTTLQAPGTTISARVQLGSRQLRDYLLTGVKLHHAFRDADS